MSGDPALDIMMMRRAIAAGHKALGRAWPNPAVGCVIVRGSEVVGEGWTGDGGRPHAEEVALAKAGDRARGADAFVTLEPCCIRSGADAACSTRLIEAGVRRVVAACEDPTPKAAGGGLQRLRAAGAEVEVGLLGDDAAVLSAGFVHRVATGRPLALVADSGEGFDAELRVAPGETVEAALERYGAAGCTRIWTPRDGSLAQLLAG